MSITPTALRLAIALVLLVFVAGTALAVDPSSEPSASANASSEASASSPSAEGSAANPTESASSPVTTAPSSIPPNEPSPSPNRAGGTDDPSETPELEEEENETAPSADKLARIVERLNGAGISATTAQVSELAAKVGVGGAIRVLAFAKASGKTSAQILALFEGGKGWGEIVHELNLPIGPGLGWIMGHGHGHGKNKDHGKPAAS